MIASTVVITELGGLNRKLTLAGAGLPTRGTTWAGETRLKTKFVNGNPEAIQHVLGPSIAPSDFEGMWRTTQLLGTPAKFVDESGTEQIITRASTLVQALETISLSGSRLRVTWSSDDGRSILREGRIGQFSFAFDRFDDVKWKCNFQWVSRGNTSQKVVTFKGEQTDAGVNAALRAIIDILGTIAASAIRSSDPTNELSASNSSLGALESLSPNYSLGSLMSGRIGASVGVGFGFGASAGFGFGSNTGFGLGVSSSSSFGVVNSGFMAGITASVQVTVANMQASVVATQAFQADSIEQAAAAAQIARGMIAQLNATLNLLGQVPPELLSSVPMPSAIARATTYVEQTRAAVQAAEQQAIALGRIARRKLASDPNTSRIDRANANEAKVIRSQAGDTFASISLREYGTPDQGSVIARANGFASFRVAPGGGVRLIVPALSSGNARSGS